ncbi:DUF3426 domain-containing protein [Marinomonas sp. THO17]|uniref:DUF3426 domain-containing protein n=1 Tax=Marinomonas sp. THO17 TaxID=3149048 RepID=UPI00336BC7FD
MANSLTTRCPKCSTAFRVSDEVLSMAKGKVRCGQCFHIFDAKQASVKASVDEANKAPQQGASVAAKKATTKTATSSSSEVDNRLAPADDAVNPDWLSTLFIDEDLQPATDHGAQQKQNAQQNRYQQRIHQAKTETVNTETAKTAANNKETTFELAPWEVELAEVEAALQARPKSAEKPTPAAAEKAAPSRAQAANKSPATSAKHTNTASQVSNKMANASSNMAKAAKASSINAERDAESAAEPDYMMALHSLAQTASEQTRPPAGAQQHSFLEQLSAQQSLAPLLEEAKAKAHEKRSHPWLWFIAIVLGLAILTGQAANHFFDEGSRSSHFRGFYRMLCSYTGCTLPRFEDVSAISIQHVRIQSHPSIPNALMVNAIITNNSAFSQPMPKIALEFFDLNGKPVAARLFAPSAYLHKDFLDITFMPPNTPIHLVIPIQDPGARAVTHELKAFPADTRSY